MPHEVYRGRYKKKYKRKTKALAMKDDYKLPSPRLAPKAGNLLTSRELDVAEESERIMDRLELRKGMMRRMRRLTPGRSGRFGRDGDGDGIYNEGKKKTGGIAPPPRRPVKRSTIAPPPPRPSGRGLSQKEIARINSRPSIADKDVIPPRPLRRKVEGRPADPPFGSRPVNPKRPSRGSGMPVPRSKPEEPTVISIRGNRIAPPPTREEARRMQVMRDIGRERLAAERKSSEAREKRRQANLVRDMEEIAANRRRREQMREADKRKKGAPSLRTRLGLDQ